MRVVLYGVVKKLKHFMMINKIKNIFRIIQIFFISFEYRSFSFKYKTFNVEYPGERRNQMF